MRNKLLMIAAMAACAFVSACGGGGGGGGSSSGPSGGSSSSAAPPPLNVSLTSSSVSLEVNDGQTGDVVSLEATVTNPGTTSYIADIQYDTAVLKLTSQTNPSTGVHKASFELKPGIEIGNYTGSITFRMCQDSACAQVIANSTKSMTYALAYVLQDWKTFQRLGDHKGYVPLNVDITKITKAWEYNGTGYLTPVAADKSLVYFTSNEASSGVYEGRAYAVEAATGNIKWSYSIPSAQAISPPALSNGKLSFTTTRSDQQSFVWVLDAATGAKLSSTSIRADTDYAASPLSPTPFADHSYVASGIDKGALFDISAIDGGVKWLANSDTVMRMTQTPAVDQDNVYYYDGQALKVFERTTGNPMYSIADPLASGAAYRYDAAPIRGSYNNVIAFSGNGKGGSYNMIGNAWRGLVVYDLTSKTVLWRYTSKLLSAQPAVAPGVIYAGESADNLIYAMNEQTGTLNWFMPVPDDFPAGTSSPATRAEFYGNMVVTKNLLFFSTANKIRAMNLATHKIVWTYDSAGMLAIGPGNILYITTAGFDSINRTLISNRKILAFKLD